jgi:hypothetical protein
MIPVGVSAATAIVFICTNGITASGGDATVIDDGTFVRRRVRVELTFDNGTNDDGNNVRDNILLRILVCRIKDRIIVVFVVGGSDAISTT